MKQVLVVVYSLTGGSRRLAQLLCSQQGWQLAEIAETQPRSGLRGMLRCVLDSVFRRHPAIRYDGPSPKNFDAVVLVSPIWFGRLAGPMRSFVARRGDPLPEVGVISVMGGRSASSAPAEVGDLIERPLIHSATITSREIGDGSCMDRLLFIGTTIGDTPAHDETAHFSLAPQAA